MTEMMSDDARVERARALTKADPTGWKQAYGEQQAHLADVIDNLLDVIDGLCAPQSPRDVFGRPRTLVKVSQALSEAARLLDEAMEVEDLVERDPEGDPHDCCEDGYCEPFQNRIASDPCPVSRLGEPMLVHDGVTGQAYVGTKADMYRENERYKGRYGRGSDGR